MASWVSNTSQSQEAALLITEKRNLVIIRATGPKQLELKENNLACNACYALDVNVRGVVVGRQDL